MKWLLSIFFDVIFISNNYACDCTVRAEYSNSEMTIEWYNSYEYVFSAVVDSTFETKEDFGTTQTVRLKIATIYKGNVANTLTITPPYVMCPIKL